MEQAQDLIRSVARAFYSSEQTVVIDALILHSAVRDDDLALLMGMQTKYVRKLCGKLREDGMLSVHSRSETRQGSNRPFSRDYYFIDTHRTIDVIKFRLARMQRDVDAKYGQTEDEKKEYFCLQCKAEYTQMEVLDVVDTMTGNFRCRRCGHILEMRSDDFGPSHSGHEVQSRLNAQLGLFEKLLKTIDESVILDNTFDEAMKNSLPVPRDQSTNPAAKTEPVPDRKLPPATVRGLATEPEKVQVEMWDEKQQAKAVAADAERRLKVAEQNKLPEWHTTSTVLSPDHGSDMKTNGALTNGTSLLPHDDKDALKSLQDAEPEKKIAAPIDTEELDKYFEEYGDDAADEDDSEEESSDDETDEDEAEEPKQKDPDDSNKSPEGPPAKKVRLNVPEPATNGGSGAVTVNGSSRGASEESEG